MALDTVNALAFFLYSIVPLGWANLWTYNRVRCLEQLHIEHDRGNISVTKVVFTIVDWQTYLFYRQLIFSAGDTINAAAPYPPG